MTAGDECLVGIDLGTSSLKVVVQNKYAQVLGMAAREYPILSPQPGWAEQEPQTWLDAALECVREALSAGEIAAARVAAVGLAGQMHSTVCLDERGVPLRPAILWADQRSAPQAQDVMQRLTRARLAEWTGNPAASGFSLPTWLWLREHEAQTCRCTACLLQPKDYLRLRLCGQLGSEPSDASATLFFDPIQMEWNDSLLDFFEVERKILPGLLPSAAPAGALRAEIAAACGLLPGTPVVCGGADQAVQALAHGVVEPGALSCTIGTGGQVISVLAQPEVDPLLRLHLFCHVIPGRWYRQAATLSAGLSLRWLRDTVFPGQSYTAIANAAAQVTPGADGLFFLPHLAGERTPYMDPAARGAFVGLTLRHGAAHLARAVMEGVVFSLRQGLELVNQPGNPLDAVIASGGAVRHALWLQLQADIFNRPVLKTGLVEAAAGGAALLAGIGTGIYADVRDACACARITYPAQLAAQPNPQHVALYDDLYHHFCRLYPAIKKFIGNRRGK